jgi:hypothetical protein
VLRGAEVLARNRLAGHDETASALQQAEGRRCGGCKFARYRVAQKNCDMHAMEQLPPIDLLATWLVIDHGHLFSLADISLAAVEQAWALPELVPEWQRRPLVRSALGRQGAIVVTVPRP